MVDFFYSSHVLLKREGIDVSLIMHGWKKGSTDMSSCSQSHAPTHLYPQPLSCLCPNSSWWRCRWVYLSCAPHSHYKWRLNVFIVQRVTRQPADGGLPWPPWTSRASFRNRHSLPCSVTHCHTSRVHYIVAAEVFFCVCVYIFVSQISPDHCIVFIETKEAWLSNCMNVRMITVERDLYASCWLIAVAASFFSKRNGICIGIESNPCTFLISQTQSSSIWYYGRCILWNMLLYTTM